MQRRGLMRALGGGLAAAALQAHAHAQAPAAAPAVAPPPLQPPPPPPGRPAPRAMGELKSLGDERFQIGSVRVDKRARSIVVPGKLIVLNKPLEFLATSPGARKSYESMLELDAIGSEVNLACILIGLERDAALPSSKPNAADKVVGQRVTLTVAWKEGEQRRQLPAGEALLGAGSDSRLVNLEWVYTGSFTSIDGARFAADFTGTLISLIPDPTGVIGAVHGGELGPYGSVRGNARLPPEGSAIELLIAPANAAK